MIEGQEAVKEVKKFIDKNSGKCLKCGRKFNEFSINRIPPKTLDYFIKLAKEEFCDDYGMTMKFLCDLHEGIIPSGNEMVELANAKAEEALAQIAELRSEVAKPQEEDKSINLVNGKKLKR